jgi:hypothetical protein
VIFSKDGDAFADDASDDISVDEMGINNDGYILAVTP